MKNTEIQLGFFYMINGRPQRAESVYCRAGNIYINDSRDFEPIELTDSFFELMGFHFYNGWYHPKDQTFDKLIFLKSDNEFLVLLGGSEIDGLVIKYVHEMQRLLFAIKNIHV